MKTRMMLWAVVVAVAVVAVPCWGRDVVVSLHNHTYYSDGFDSPEEVCEKAIEAGAEVVAINDHAEMVDWTVLPQYGNLKKRHFGVDSWARDLDLARQRCEQLGRKLIYGAELGIGQSRHNHALAWIAPESPEAARRLALMSQLANTLGGLDDGECAMAMKNSRFYETANVSFAAAHPTNGSYPFDFGWQMDVYETFNHYRDNASTFDYIAANAGSPPRPKSIVAGTDYHCGAGTAISAFVAQSSAGNRYLPEMYRFTIARADDNSATSVLQAIRERRCYAAFMNARITDASCWPGEECLAGKPLRMEVEGIGFDTRNYFGGSDANTVYVLAINAASGLSLRWEENFTSGGGFRVNLPRLDDGGRWFVYLDISHQIVTSAITVLPSASPRLVSSTGPVCESPSIGGQVIQYFPGPPIESSSDTFSSGEKFVGREQWGDGAITATYIRQDERFGTLYLQYAPSGNIYRYSIDLEQNCQGLERCEIPGRVMMERTEKGRAERLSTDEESTAIQHMKATKRSPEYYILDFGYAFPAGNTPQARVGGITGTPNIKLHRAQE